MKFVCVPCNVQMKLKKSGSKLTPDAKGSLSVLYECPECLIEIGMLTNAFETQLVSSLGVEIGGETITEGPGEQQEGGKCPFSKMARSEMVAGLESTAGEADFLWTAQAAVRLEKMPEFVRPMAKKGIEKFARENGYSRVDELCLDRAKQEFGM